MRTTPATPAALGTHLPVFEPLRSICVAANERGVLFDLRMLASLESDDPRRNARIAELMFAPRRWHEATGVLHSAPHFRSAKSYALTQVGPNRLGSLRDLAVAAIPRPGHIFVKMDFGHASAATLAHASGDTTLKTALLSGDPFAFLTDRLAPCGIDAERDAIRTIFYRAFSGIAQPNESKKTAFLLRTILPQAFQLLDKLAGDPTPLHISMNFEQQALQVNAAEVVGARGSIVRIDNLCTVFEVPVDDVEQVLTDLRSLTSAWLTPDVALTSHLPTGS